MILQELTERLPLFAVSNASPPTFFNGIGPPELMKYTLFPYVLGANVKHRRVGNCPWTNSPPADKMVV